MTLILQKHLNTCYFDHTLYEAICEGVETQYEFDTLFAVRCDYAQRHLFQPRPAEECEQEYIQKLFDLNNEKVSS